MEECCKNCRHVHVGVGFIHPPLTCANKPGWDGRWFIVEPTGWCRNFKPKYGEEEEISNIESFDTAQDKLSNKECRMMKAGYFGDQKT